METPLSHRAEYANRINRVVDHIQQNLGEPLDLERLARLACFSPFHFHRLFRGWMGETLQQFIQRLRLERAAHQLCFNPKKSITAIALDVGFSGSDTFARAFKDHFGCSASTYRTQSKMRQLERKGSQATDPIGNAPWEPGGQHPAPWHKEIPMFPLTVQVQDFSPMTVAYVRNVGPYKGNSALFERLFGQLCAWAGPRGLIGPQATFLSIYHDNPDLTPDSKLRLEVAITVPPGTPVEGEIGRMELQGGPYAVARVSIQPHQYEDVWQSLMVGWLPESGYQPDDRPALELYRNDPSTDPEGRHILDICMPVKPL